MKERIQKLLAQANIASRRASEELIEQGRVFVNGQKAKLGDKADPDTDTIEVDGQRLKFNQPHVYIAVNKPKNVLVTHKAHRTDDRRTIIDMIGREERLFAIGRLDADSEGLVVLTNDGDLAQKLTHPSYRHTKTYRVDVYGLPAPETLEKWQDGIWLEGERTAPCLVEIVDGDPKLTTLRISMTEGKKRQIRRVAKALGHPVKRLFRTHIGMLSLNDLDIGPGEWRELKPEQVKAMSTPSPAVRALRRRPAPARKQRDEAEGGADQPRRSPAARFRRDDDQPRDDRPPRSGFKRREGDSEDRPRRSPAARFRRDDDRQRDERPPRSGFKRRDGDSEDRPRRSPAARFRRDDERQSDDRPPRAGFKRREGDREDRPRRSPTARVRRDDERQSDDRPSRSRTTSRPRSNRDDDKRPAPRSRSGGTQRDDRPQRRSDDDRKRNRRND